MTGKDVEIYIREELDSEPRHNVKALATAVNKASKEFENDPLDLLSLLLANKPITKLMTHSYGFHTAIGRHVIETIKEYYYEGVSSSN